MDMKESRSCCRFRSSRERDAEKHVPRKIHGGNCEIQEWKGLQRTKWGAHQVACHVEDV